MTNEIPRPYKTQGPRFSNDGRIVEQTRIWQTAVKDHDVNLYRLQLVARFDDSCGNGHETFSVTARSLMLNYDREANGPWGAAHDDLAKAFPWIGRFLKWHGCSTDGPSGYIANTIHFASDRDCWGLKKGEKRQIHNGKTGLPAWELVADKELPKYVDSKERPTETTTLRYQPWCHVGEGRQRDLERARQTAIWPDAPEELLTGDPEQLKAALEERLPRLLEEFKRDMIALGFVYPEV